MAEIGARGQRLRPEERVVDSLRASRSLAEWRARDAGGDPVNALLVVSLVFEAVFAVGFVLAPGPMLGPLGVHPSGVMTTFVRMFGSALLAFPVLLWMARASEDLVLRRAAVRTLFTYYLVSTAVLLVAQTGGQLNAMGWAVVAAHAVFTFWFGCYLRS
jgi:hypothetical protein